MDTRIDISDQPAATTRTDLLATFEAVTEAAIRLAAARYTQLGTDTERAEYGAEYDAARNADIVARQAMIDAIYALGIPA